MPSYFDDEHSTTLFSTSDSVIALDNPAKFGLPPVANTPTRHVAHEESNANTSITTDASFDETCETDSTARSDVTDATPLPVKPGGLAASIAEADGRDERRDDDGREGPTSTAMAGTPNGKPVEGTGHSAVKKVEDRAGQNGYAVPEVDARLGKAVDGQAVEPAKNNTASPKTSSDVAMVRTSLGSLQQSPVEYYQRGVKGANSESASPIDGSAAASLNAAPTSFITPASPIQLPERKAGSTHRFSSPPQYNPSASSPSLHPPAPGQLRQRHTLEVPKLPAGRTSRDGIDSYATGRFSPTMTSAPRRASLSLGRRNTRSIQSEFHRDEVVPDDDAIRWAEAVRQKRMSKKRRREEEGDDRVLVGTKVDEHHVNWVTAYNMLTGIRVSVSRTNAKLDRELTDADFQAKQKSTFDVAGNELVPSAKYDFKFKDYAPWVFRRLRALFRLDPADYLMSLTGKYILSELGSPGKSGSFFYFSRDYKYIIKTIHHAEHKFLRKVLKDYYEHVTNNPNTLLSQFYGLHRVKIPYGKKIHFVVMNNLFPPHRDIHQTFDLKGSTVSREYKEDDAVDNPRATLKDLNWMRRHKHLELGIQKKRLFLDQLQRDVQLLKRLEIMDYSLLVGIHDVQKGNEENLRSKTLRVFNPGGDEVSPSDDPEISVLLRTPSKLENARKAKELRQMLRQEKPVPMGQTTNRMPNELEEGSRAGFLFRQDDGGFRATHDDNTSADEVYYLGVIDCLTHYGVIKKIEHFWKGLSSDSSKISAVPPDEYGERFYTFIEGVTMSPGEAEREAETRQQVEAAQQPVSITDAEGRASSWSSRRRSPSTTTAPARTAPAAVAGTTPTHRSPEAQATVDRATVDAAKSDHNEDEVPNRTIVTKTDKAGTAQQQILPVVEESGETSSTGGRSHQTTDDGGPGTPLKQASNANNAINGTLVNRSPTPSVARLARSGSSGDLRPATPRKDSTPRRSGEQGGVPATPPKYLKPDTADSGYAANGFSSPSRENSFKVLRSRISRESLNKELPPLPKHTKAAADENRQS